MISGQQRTVTLPSGDRVSVNMSAESQGTPLLLIHGFMGTSASWKDAVAALPAWVRWAALDLPGHGGSSAAATPERFSIPKIAAELDAVQRAVFGGPAWWLGYSMGGRIALAAACEGVVLRGVLLESASPGLGREAERAERRVLDEDRASRLETEGTAAFVDTWLELPLFAGLRALPGPVQEGIREVRARQDPDLMAAWLRGGGTGSQPSYWESLHALEVPVHVLAGVLDGKFTAIAEEMVQAIPDATLTRVPGAGHVPHLEDPDVWASWVERALKGGASAREA